MRNKILAALLIILLSAHLVVADDTKCDHALNTCVSYVEAQETEIAALKKQNVELMDKLSSAEQSDSLLTSVILPVAFGFLVGYAISR